MIFAAEYAKQTQTLLTESGANWLLIATDQPDDLKLVYLDKSDIKSVTLSLTDKGWQIYTNKTKPDHTINEFIINYLTTLFINKPSLLSWNPTNSIRLLPVKSEMSTLEFHNSPYLNNTLSKHNPTETTASTLVYDSNNWVHEAALKNILLDVRIYPFLTSIQNYNISTISKDMVKISVELKKLFNKEKPDLDDELLAHPYYKKIREAFNYRVNEILKAISVSTIESNIKTADVYNKLMQGKKEFVSRSKAKKDITSIAVPCQHVNIASCQGDKPNQEDRAAAIAGINLHASWQKRIPELLVYAIQTLANKLYEENFAETSYYAIGSTLSLIFIDKVDDNTYAYTASLGDSPLIEISTGNTTGLESTTARYLYSPHSANPEIMTTEELERVSHEGGTIEKVDVHYRLNRSLMVTGALGDRCIGYGTGVTDIPRVAVYNLSENDTKITLLIGSDGLTDYLSLTQIVELYQKTSTENLSVAYCEAAYSHAPKRSDNIIAVVLSECQGGMLAYVLDGHGIKNGDLVAEYANQHLHNIFKQLAEKAAPQAVHNLSAENAKAEALDLHYSSDEDSSQKSKSSPKKRKLEQSIDLQLFKKQKGVDSDTKADNITRTAHISNESSPRRNSM